MSEEVDWNQWMADHPEWVEGARQRAELERGCTNQTPCRADRCPFCDPIGYLNMPLGGPGGDDEPRSFGALDPPDDGPDLLAGLRSGDWLDQQQFPPLHYPVPGVIPEGMTLLVGAPKIGKSWLVLGLLLGVASGGAALGGIRLGEPRRVLYLALEDGDRRMQDRCRQLLEGDPIPPLYTYLTQVPPGRILDTIEAALDRYPDTAMVVIDTLGKVMPQAMPQETTYQRDYRVAGKLKAIADDKPGLALVVIHHDRKAGADDFVERVSGSNGLAGAADTIVVLSRERQSADGLLQITGRDISEGEYALTVTGGAWALDGGDLDAAAKRAQERQATAGLGDRSVEVLQAINEHPEGLSPSDVAAVVGIEAVHARVYLGRLLDAGRIAKPRRGLYTPVTSVTSVTSAPPPNTHNTPSESVVTPSVESNEVTEVTAPLRECSCGRTLQHPGELERGICIRCRRAQIDREAA